MSCVLYASPSQDALIIALSLFVIGLADRILSEARQPSRNELLIMTLAISLVGMAKPPYWVFAVLPLLVGRKVDSREIISTTLILLICTGWTAFSLIELSVNMNGADASTQFQYLLENPFIVVSVAYSKLRSQTWGLG